MLAPPPGDGVRLVRDAGAGMNGSPASLTTRSLASEIIPRPPRR